MIAQSTDPKSGVAGCPYRRCRRHRRAIPVVLSLVVSLGGCGEDQGRMPPVTDAPADLSIGRMRVAIWPEYDDRSVLVIYDGKFETGSRFPVRTSFLIPEGAVINDACSVSFEGQHFCQLYKSTNKGEFDEVRLVLPYPNFYLSFHTLPIDVETERRAFDYGIKTNHPVSSMEVDVQQPLRTTSFNISPPSNALSGRKRDGLSIVKGFNHYAYEFTDISAGDQSIFGIEYVKDDPNPSVDIKYASMEGAKVWGSPYGTQKQARTYVYVLFGTAMLGIGAVFVSLIRRGKAKRLDKEP